MAIRATDEQLKVIHALDRPLFVSAGAGSGKSSTLAERVAYALTPGSGEGGAPYISSLDQVLVITFTKAAAIEIRERIRTRLRKDPELSEHALEVDGAWISTIHGMCSRILRRHAFELGLDPGFSIIPETVADQLLAESLDLTFRIARNEGLYPELFKAFPVSGGGFASGAYLSDMVSAIREAAANSSEGMGSVVFPGEPDDLCAELASLSDAIRAYLETGRDEGWFTTEAAQKEVDALSEVAYLLAERSDMPVDDPLALADWVGDLKAPAARYGKDEGKARAKELKAAYAELASRARVVFGAARAPELFDLAQATERIFARKKARSGYLDNNDLMRLTLIALREFPEIRELYADKFRLVMVDEFQDTNHQQVELISMLSGKDAEHLATVGDAQQSIYRFRAADVSVFRDRENDPNTNVLRLTQNFRSHSDILSFVRATLGHGLLDSFMDLEPTPTRADGYKAKGEPRISLEVVSGPGSGVNAAAQEVLAYRMATRFSELRDAGEPTGNMALLFGRMTNSGTYLDALRAQGLECVVTGGSTFSASPDVAVVSSLLSLFANARDTQAGLFPVLTSDMFLVEADDLLALSSVDQDAHDAPTKRRIDVGLRDFVFPEGCEPSAVLLRAHDVLVRAFSRLDTWPVDEVLLAAVRESGWLARLEQEGPVGSARIADILAAIRYVKQIAAEDAMGLTRAAYEFSHWLELAKVGPASLAGDALDVIQVMTVHASKGLEFGVVGVTECFGRTMAHSYSGIVREEKGGAVKAALLPAKTGLSSKDPEFEGIPYTHYEWARHLCSRDARESFEESSRLLYVALTRAKEALVVGTTIFTTKDGKTTPELAAGFLESLFGESLPATGVTTVDYGGTEPAHVHRVHVQKGDEGFVCEPELEMEQQAQEISRELALFAPEPADLSREILLEPRAWPGREGVFSYSSAHAIVQEEEGRRFRRHTDGRGWDELDDTETAAQTDDADRATDLGSAFHELVQLEAEQGSEATGDQVSAKERFWGLSTAACARLEAALARWHGSDIRKEALSWPRRFAEQPFFCPVEDSRFGSFVEGYIDLLCCDEAGKRALVVDFKTGDAKLSVEEIHASHEMQANFYAWVLMQQGFEEVECAFVCVERDAEAAQPIVARYSFGAGRAPQLIGD